MLAVYDIFPWKPDIQCQGTKPEIILKTETGIQIGLRKIVK